MATSRIITVSQSYKTSKNSYRIKSENETVHKKVLSKRQKVERDAEDMMSSGKWFWTFEGRGASEDALLPTVCKQREGTTRQSVTAERSACQLGMSVTRMSGPR